MRLSVSRIVGRLKKLARGQPKCFRLIRSVVTGNSGLEIGGPSAVFRQRSSLPIYDSVSSLDNCDFSQANTWASHKHNYRFSERRPAGKSFTAEGSNLADIADRQYDFILSSHNLEHFANPVKALKEWQRVLKPGGHLVLVLPYYVCTFDHRRVPTLVTHMLEDFRNDIGEDDLTHVEETIIGQRGMFGPEDEHRQALLKNFQHRMMHHHVFDEANSRALLEAVNFTVLAVGLHEINIYLVAQTPSS